MIQYSIFYDYKKIGIVEDIIFFIKAFVRDVDIDSGTLVSREPQTRRLCKHSLIFSQCNKYH